MKLCCKSIPLLSQAFHCQSDKNQSSNMQTNSRDTLVDYGSVREANLTLSNFIRLEKFQASSLQLVLKIKHLPFLIINIRLSNHPCELTQLPCLVQNPLAKDINHIINYQTLQILMGGFQHVGIQAKTETLQKFPPC